jgi:hypothetical protein
MAENGELEVREEGVCFVKVTMITTSGVLYRFQVLGERKVSLLFLSEAGS